MSCLSYHNIFLPMRTCECSYVITHNNASSLCRSIDEVARAIIPNIFALNMTALYFESSIFDVSAIFVTHLCIDNLFQPV